MERITRKQVTKSAVFIAIGAAPGFIWFLSAGTTQSIVITCLCALVALLLSLPGVSAARVARGTAGAILAYNAPRSVRGAIIDATFGEKEPPKTAEPRPDFSFLDESKKNA